MTIANSTDIAVRRASSHELPIIESMMQFYNYDLSAYCSIDLDQRGMYTLSPKQAYWAHAAVVPYLLRVDGAPSGFAVVDDEVQDRQSQFNMGYFFVARRYRGSGLASRLAAEIFHRHPGRWEVYHYANNAPAKHFWPRAITAMRATKLATVDAMGVGESEGQALVRYFFSVAPSPQI